ncbi:MAG TPA: hypothetical protein VFV07_06300, partial [Rhizomicrobium sp.]|nr:hypothetical protein [Rhizomicrobium sp.]
MAALALAAALAPCASRAADAPRPLSYTQVQALSQADLIKLVVEQAASFIETAPPHRYNAMRVATALKIDAPPTPALLAAAVREKLATLTSGLAAYHLDAQDKTATRQQLRRIELWTKPHATAVSSLCGSEMV